MITDLAKTKENIKKFELKSSQDVRLLGKPLIEFSDAMTLSMREIRALTTKMYKHYEINRMTSKAKRIVSDLFKIYSKRLTVCQMNGRIMIWHTFLEIELFLITLPV